MSDSVYLMIIGAVTLEYVDVVREISRATTARPVCARSNRRSVGTDLSGRPCFVSSKDVWMLDPPVVLPSPQRSKLILVYRINAGAQLREDGPWRWIVVHARAIDRRRGEIGEHRREFCTAPGVSDLFGPRQVLGA